MTEQELFFLEKPNREKLRGLMPLEQARKMAKETKFTGYLQSVKNKNDCEAYSRGELITYAIGERVE